MDEDTKWCDEAYGYSEENCDKVLKKVRHAQLEFFNDSLSTDEIRYTQYHKNICGTIQ